MKSNYPAADWSFYSGEKVLLSLSLCVEKTPPDLLHELFIMQAKHRPSAG